MLVYLSRKCEHIKKCGQCTWLLYNIPCSTWTCPRIKIRRKIHLMRCWDFVGYPYNDMHRCFVSYTQKFSSLFCAKINRVQRWISSIYLRSRIADDGHGLCAQGNVTYIMRTFKGNDDIIVHAWTTSVLSDFSILFVVWCIYLRGVRYYYAYTL